MIRHDASPPSRKNSCRDMRAGCWSHTLKQTVSSRETPRCTCKAPLNTLIDSKSQPPNAGMERSFFVVTCRVTWNQADMLSHAGRRCLHILHTREAWCPLQSHIGDSRKQHSAKPAESKRAESLSAQPLKETLEVRMGPALLCTNAHTHTLRHRHTLSQVQLLTAQSSIGFQGRTRGEEGGRSRGQPVEHKSPSAAQANYIPPLLN